nr:helix-turn-helix transcriptional regulator [Duncaniella muris]
MFSDKLDVSPSEITITSLDEKLVEKAIRIVEEHMSDSDFSVELLSSELALSRGYLYKKLMAITGKGPAEFIRTIRLKRARQLLEQSQMQVAEIAYMCGFNSPRRFAQNFKNEFGMLPSEFLKGRT